MILGLEDRNTARVVAARFISRAGGEAAFFVGIWGKAAYEFDATPAQQALVMASLGVFSLIGSALAGVLIDRFDPRRVLIVSEILFVPATLALVLPDNIGDMTLVGRVRRSHHGCSVDRSDLPAPISHHRARPLAAHQLRQRSGWQRGLRRRARHGRLDRALLVARLDFRARRIHVGSRGGSGRESRSAPRRNE